MPEQRHIVRPLRRRRDRPQPDVEGSRRLQHGELRARLPAHRPLTRLLRRRPFERAGGGWTAFAAKASVRFFAAQRSLRAEENPNLHTYLQRGKERRAHVRAPRPARPGRGHRLHGRRLTGRHRRDPRSPRREAPGALRDSPRRKLGIGSAVDGIAYAYDRGHKRLVTLDSSFTHTPETIPEFLARGESSDVVIGSRYIESESLPGWTIFRRSLQTPDTSSPSGSSE